MGVHDYRNAIADDCIVGMCSQNNCLFPDCSPSALKEEAKPDLERMIRKKQMSFPASEFDAFDYPPVLRYWIAGGAFVSLLIGLVMWVFDK